MKKDRLKEFEKENYFEINDADLELKHLRCCGIKDETLAYEVFLREIYGDVMTDVSIVDDYDASKKKQVVKITDDEKNKNTEFLNICEEIDNSEFDEILDKFK